MEKLKGGQVGEYPKKLIVSTHGFAGEGKTTLLLTFPPPLYIVNCGDRDIKHLLAKLPENYDIFYEYLAFDVDSLSRTVATQMLERAEAMLKLALRAGTGSLILDGADLLQELATAALVDERSNTSGLRYKGLNEWWFSFLGRAVKAPNLQIGMSAMAAEIWDGPNATGRYKPAGWKHIDRYIETQIRMFHKEQMDSGRKPTAVQNPTVTHAGYIEKSKKAEHLTRRIFDNPTFAFLYKATYGEAWPEEEKLWKPS